MSEIIVMDGKYKFVKKEEDYRVHCLRYNEDWMIFSKGSNAISSLMYEYEQLQAENERLRQHIEAAIEDLPHKPDSAKDYLTHALKEQE